MQECIYDHKKRFIIKRRENTKCDFFYKTAVEHTLKHFYAVHSLTLW